MEIIDLVILVPVLWGMYKGFTKGLIGELSHFLALVLGCVLGAKFSYIVSDFIIKSFNINDKILPIISFVIIFFVVVLGVHLIAKALINTTKKLSIGWINTLGGLLLGGFKFMIIIGLVLQIVLSKDQNSNIIDKETKKNSILIEPTLKMVNFVSPYLKKAIFDAQISKERKLDIEQSSDKDS